MANRFDNIKAAWRSMLPDLTEKQIDSVLPGNLRDLKADQIKVLLRAYKERPEYYQMIKLSGNKASLIEILTAVLNTEFFADWPPVGGEEARLEKVKRQEEHVAKRQKLQELREMEMASLVAVNHQSSSSSSSSSSTQGRQMPPSVAQNQAQASAARAPKVVKKVVVPGLETALQVREYL